MVDFGSSNLVPAHPTEYKLPGRSEHMLASNGHINASSKADALKTIGQIFQCMSSGQLGSMVSEEEVNRKAKLKEDRKELIKAALADPTGRIFKSVGTAIGAEIYQTANREGFMRRFLQKAPLEMGTIPRIRFAYKTQYAVAAASSTAVQPLETRSKFLLPPEFYIQDALLIEEREIMESSEDVLEEKLLEGQEAIMVKEDLAWKNLVLKQVNTVNQRVNVTGAFTPQILQVMRNSLISSGLPADNFLFASDLWNDILTNQAFVSFYDPVTQFEIVQTGVIGRILGLTLMSDAYRVPQLRVLKQGEMFMTSRPEYHGAYTDRGPVSARELDGASNSAQPRPARGWYLSELMSMCVPNAASCVVGQRKQ